MLNNLIFFLVLNRKKITKLEKKQIYNFYLSLFFYKNNFYKNSFYKNIHCYYNLILISNEFKQDVTFSKFLFNFFMYKNTSKIASINFINQYDSYINYNFFENSTQLIKLPDDFKDEFNDIFLKKNKNFFFKSEFNSYKINNFINIFLFNKLNNFFFKKNLNSLVLPNSFFIFLFFFKSFYFFKKNKQKYFYNSNVIFFKKKFFFFNLDLKFLKKHKKLHHYNHLKLNLNNFTFFFKKKNFFFENFYKNNSLVFNKVSSFYNFNEISIKSDNFLDFSRNDIFLKNFFFKNYFLVKYNKNLFFSNNFINSYFYNSFFEDSCYVNNSKFLTNYTPYNYLNDFLIRKIFSKLNVNYVPSFYRYVYYSVANSIEYLLKKKIFLKIFSKSITNKNSLDHIDSLFSKNRSMQSRIGRGFFLHEMLDILYMTFLQKDLNFLIKWFVKTMNRISFLNHKKFISSFKQIVINNSDFFIKKNNIRGFFFDIRGKVGVTGDAKKRHFSFYVGDFSKTSKKYKFDYQFDIVRTYTGALGITMYLSYS